MARNVSEIIVFVASPGDVAEERQVLERTISELNDLWCNTKAIRLRLVRWETDAYPDLGADAQSVINEQIGDNYDIFIGILWARFGTSTCRAPSGTMEEFHRAYDRYASDPKALRIMFYFRTSAVDLDDIDPAELEKVKGFRSELGKKGLYSTYKDVGEFERLVRLHLSRHIDDWGKKWGVGALPTAQLAEDSTIHDGGSGADESLNDEEGFLDLIVEGTQQLNGLDPLMSQMLEAVETLGEKFTQRTSEIMRASEGGPDRNVKSVKRICDRAADDLEQFSTIMEVQIPLFAERFSKGIDAYSRAASLIPDFDPVPEEAIALLQQSGQCLGELEGAMGKARKPTQEFRQVIGSMPPVTKRYSRAKRKAATVLACFVEEIDSGMNQIKEAITALESIREELSGRHS